MTFGVWIFPTLLTALAWAGAYYRDRADSDYGSLWAYAALGATVSSWIFYACLWIPL